jgi:hypothetical protein
MVCPSSAHIRTQISHKKTKKILQCWGGEACEVKRPSQIVCSDRIQDGSLPSTRGPPPAPRRCSRL